MASDSLFAVFDVRERGEYNDGQIPGATSLPRSQIEFRIQSLVPDRSISLFLYDGADGRALLAAKTLAELGYSEISILDGGLPGWRNDGRQTVSGVNVPSKAFGEKIHHERNIPDVMPGELKALAEGGTELLIIDARTPEEYGRFCIPGGLNVPGGDLILWADELRRKKDATVIVNCAGRTRSIVGTAALRRLGLTNVRALKNGTMGWVLAGLDLEKNPARTTPEPPVQSRAAAETLARQMAAEEKLAWISPQELSRRLAEPSDGFVYLIDVRSEAEFESAHIAGSLSVPGGQAVQRADDFVAVRNAEIVFISDESARAVMAAYWYRQMGFPHVSILQGGLRAWSECGYELARGAVIEEPLGLAAAQFDVTFVDAQSFAAEADSSSSLILDVGTSLDFEAAHLPGAKWLSRGWLELELPRQYSDRERAIVVSCADGRQSIFAARALFGLAYKKVRVLAGGVRAWRAAGMRTETGLDGCLVQAKDVVLSPSIRGTKEDMQRYLDWETKLER
jgi:rhodanese-related sulfurtransferase